MICRSVPILLAALLASASVRAESYDVDPGHTTVLFRVKHLQTAEFFGRFNDVKGVLKFDPAKLDEASVEVTVKAASVDTHSEGRDKHLRGEEFFHAEKHPDIVFKAQGFTKTKKSDVYTVTGTLTLRGQTKPLTVEVKYTGEGKDPWGGYRLGFLTSFTIKRTEFGMNFPTHLLSDDVELTVSLEGVRKLRDEEESDGAPKRR